MERVLIAYYSFEGHTEKIAEEIASRIRQNGGEADLLRIRVKKEPPHAGMGKFMVGGWMALTQKDPGILNEEIDLDSYDRIFLGMPVWAGNAPGAIAAFIRKTHPQGKDFYLFAVSGGGDDKKTLSKTINNLQGNHVIKTISLQQGGLTDVLDAFVDAPVSQDLLADVQKYINENYEDFEAEEATEPEEAAEVINAAREAMPLRDAAPSAARPREAMPTGFARSQETVYAEHASYAGSAPAAFELDEGFSELLFQLIDERGWKDADCYKKANVSKQVFSNIRSNPQYLPSKTTVLALAIALELDLDETKKLLERAGYAISHSSLADVIVEYFIVHKRYNIFEINQTLFEHDQKILGSK
ncbi:MAG: hypothetical protein IKI32_01345 [Lachnospiraceae bacterium]|nr:hypothetical protein [Lachnospiraceae bacterium]